MRKIERTTQFKRDFKREMKGGNRKVLDNDLPGIIEALCHDRPLAKRHRDHALGGNWKDFRDCHIRSDLIYRKPDPETLQLVRLGSHSELGL